jgi:hypothetical protein
MSETMKLFFSGLSLQGPVVLQCDNAVVHADREYLRLPVATTLPAPQSTEACYSTKSGTEPPRRLPSRRRSFPTKPVTMLESKDLLKESLALRWQSRWNAAPRHISNRRKDMSLSPPVRKTFATRKRELETLPRMLNLDDEKFISSCSSHNQDVRITALMQEANLDAQTSCSA